MMLAPNVGASRECSVWIQNKRSLRASLRLGSCWDFDPAVQSSSHCLCAGAVPYKIDVATREGSDGE